MTDASNVVDMSGTMILPTYDPNWKARFDQHLAENNRLNEIPVPHCLSEEHREKVERAAKGWQDAFHAQFRTLSDYLEWTKGWSVHRTRAGRMIPWPELEADATVETVHETVGELKVLTERVSAAEYGLERTKSSFGVFDMEPAEGFKRSVYTAEDCWSLWDSDKPYTMGVVEDRNAHERHVAIVPPILGSAPYLQPWTLEGFLERTGLVENVRPNWFDRLRSRLKGPRTFVYLYRAPDPRCRSVRLERYELSRHGTSDLEDTERAFEVSPRALIDLWIASDPSVVDALRLPVWSDEAWNAFYGSSAERKKAH